MNRIGIFLCFVYVLVSSASLYAQVPPPPPPPKTIDGVSTQDLRTPPPPQTKKSSQAKKSKKAHPPNELPRSVPGGVPGGIPGGVPGGAFAPPPEAPIKWLPFTAPDESFRVLMPSKPQPRTQIVESPAGKIRMQIYLSIHGATGYMAAYGDSPTAIDSPDYAKTALTAIRDKIAAQANAQIISDKEITYEQYPGREIKFQSPTVTVLGRTYFINNRIYQMQILVPTGLGDPDFYSQQYFDSFKVLKVTSKNLVTIESTIKAATPPPNFFDKPVQWQAFSSAEGRFKVAMPREPFHSSMAGNLSDKRNIEHLFISKGSEMVCYVSYRDLLGDKDVNSLNDVVFAGARDMILQGMEEWSGKIVSESDISFRGYKGKEYKLGAGGSVKLTGIAKTFIVNRRVYYLMAVYPARETAVQEAEKFTSSFTFIEKESK